MTESRGGTFQLWRVRALVKGLPRELRCSIEQLGEGCFELRVHCGHELLRVEDFDDAGQLLRRAEQLRAEAHASG